MKLTETIEECIKLVIDEMESCDVYINEYEDRTGYGSYVEKWKEKRKKWTIHLENLKFIQAENLVGK